MILSATITMAETTAADTTVPDTTAVDTTATIMLAMTTMAANTTAVDTTAVDTTAPDTTALESGWIQQWWIQQLRFSTAFQTSAQQDHRRKPLQMKQLSDLLRIATMDNFKGEEAKMIIMSLVRNDRKRVDFFKATNRVNVLLS
jgi:hypothetical protein